jgi:V/A-type H+-transporting ATPase subunit I
MTLRPEHARWFELLTTREDLTLAVETLARTGSVELETYSQTRTPVSLDDLQERMEEYNRFARRYESYWPRPEVEPTSLPGTPQKILDNALQHLAGWEQVAAPLILQLESLSGERSELETLRTMLEELDTEEIDFELLANAAPPLAARLFALPPDARLAEVPGSLLTKRVAAGPRHFLLAVGVSADLDLLGAELAAHKGRPVNVPRMLRGNTASALRQVRQRLQELEAQAKALRNRVGSLAGPHQLVEALANIDRLDWFLTHVTSLPVSENFAWVTGWTSDLSGKKLQAALDNAGVNGMVHFPSPPRQMAAPMVMQNPWWARPFEVFANLLGTPSHDEADPSRLVAMLVPLLFGYMFGDVGQGLVLLMTGIVFQRRWPLLRILIANGIASILFGFVFGSVFGREDLLPALWVHPVEEPLPVLMVPLAGGVVIIMLGLILNAVESYWRREIGLWWQVEAAIPVLYLSIIGSFFVPQMLLLAGVAVIWFFAGSVLHGQGKRWAKLLAAAGTLVESVLQLLINTVSFVRVGAFALAHGGLSLAFNIMADATDSLVAGGLILLLGNLIVIMLEGLVVTIQTTRLILFEFFIRFLRGSGRMFRPLAAPDAGVDKRRTT